MGGKLELYLCVFILVHADICVHAQPCICMFTYLHCVFVHVCVYTLACSQARKYQGVVGCRAERRSEALSECSWASFQSSSLPVISQADISHLQLSPPAQHTQLSMPPCRRLPRRGARSGLVAGQLTIMRHADYTEASHTQIVCDAPASWKITWRLRGYFRQPSVAELEKITHLASRDWRHTLQGCPHDTKKHSNYQLR